MTSCDVVSERMNLIWGTGLVGVDGSFCVASYSLFVSRILSRFWRMSFNGMAAWGMAGFLQDNLFANAVSAI